jgi:glycosyltransferase involved in cell wall biosynthesis
MGNDVTVVTVNPKDASYKNMDDSFMELISKINVVQTSTLEPLKTYSLLTTGSSHKGIPRGGVNNSKSIFKKLASMIKENLFVPDARVGWNKFAKKAAQEIIHRELPDVVVTTGPPQSTHLVGVALKKLFPKLIWMADFRDPWIELFSIDQASKSAWANKRNTKLELSVLTNADSILTIGPSMQRLLQQKMPRAQQDKVTYIYNGFDDVKMENAPILPSDTFTIIFVGLLADEYPSDGFVSALKQLGDSVAKIKLILAGNIAKKFINKVNEIDNLEVDVKGFVSHEQSLSLMKSASMLFTILPSLPNDEIIISGKMMEYIAARKPILCIGNKKGDAAALIQESNSGVTFNSQESNEMLAFIKKCMQEEGTLNADYQSIAQYNRKSTAVQLDQLLDELVKK